MPPRKSSRVAALLLALVMLLTLIPFQSLASDSPAAKTGSDTANETLYSVSDADASAAAQAEGDDTSSSAVEIPLFSDYLWVALMEVKRVSGTMTLSNAPSGPLSRRTSARNLDSTRASLRSTFPAT